MKYDFLSGCHEEPEEGSCLSLDVDRTACDTSSTSSRQITPRAQASYSFFNCRTPRPRTLRGPM